MCKTSKECTHCRVLSRALGSGLDDELGPVWRDFPHSLQVPLKLKSSCPEHVTVIDCLSISFISDIIRPFHARFRPSSQPPFRRWPCRRACRHTSKWPTIARVPWRILTNHAFRIRTYQNIWDLWGCRRVTPSVLMCLKCLKDQLFLGHLQLEATSVAVSCLISSLTVRLRVLRPEPPSAAQGAAAQIHNVPVVLYGLCDQRSATVPFKQPYHQDDTAAQRR